VISTPGTAVFRANIRGSSLLMVGRALSIGIKFLVQVLIVRHLSTSDYGAWAYALSIVALLDGFASLGLNRDVARFTAIYHERKQHGAFFGAILLVAATILVTGLIFAIGVYAFPGTLASLIGGETQPLTLLFIMIFMVPLTALDALSSAIFATFGRPRAIFFRRYLLAPGLQITVVLLLIVRESGVVFLAWGYLLASLVGVALNAWLVLRMLRADGLTEGFSWRGIQMPFREMFSLSLPLLSEDFLAALVRSSGVLLLGYYYGTEQIALFHVVLAVAAQTKLVIESFAMLYVPAASRFFASGNYTGINDLYWQTAVWIAVLSFPIFAATFTVATPLTVLLFGEKYAPSGLFLTVLAVGGFVEAAFGFNRQTLRVLGRVRYVMVINLLAAAANVALAVLLVPTLGALGAAIAMSGTWIINNLLRQAGLFMADIGFSVLDRRYRQPYAAIGLGALVLWLARATVENPLMLAATAASVSIVVLVVTRRSLQIADVFPRLARVPILRSIVT
jgi:O-antigen/teichoic acid export membrane protein